MLGSIFWTLVPLVAAWQAEPADNAFLQRARQEIDSFHHALFSLERFPLATQPRADDSEPKVTKYSKNSKSAKGKSNHQREKSQVSKQGKSSSYDNEAGKKGYSKADKESKNYGEAFGKKGDEYFTDGVENEHHSSSNGAGSGRFRDRLLHKKGNYEKGYRDKYHLDEILKQEKFWSDHHSIDRIHRYGHKDSKHHKKHQSKFNQGEKKAGKQSETHGKNGKSSRGSNSSEHKGHKEESGERSKYDHKKEYSTKKEE